MRTIIKGVVQREADWIVGGRVSFLRDEYNVFIIQELAFLQYIIFHEQVAIFFEYIEWNFERDSEQIIEREEPDTNTKLSLVFELEWDLKSLAQSQGRPYAPDTVWTAGIENGIAIQRQRAVSCLGSRACY